MCEELYVSVDNAISLLLSNVHTHDRRTISNYHITITAIAQLKLQTTNHHHQYMASVLSTDDWDRLGYSDWPNRQPPDLTYPINPIFKKERFWGCEEEWYLIEPALRLASAFLATPTSMLFIYSCVYECKRLPSQSDIESEPHYQFRLTEERDPKVLLPRALDPQEGERHHVWIVSLWLRPRSGIVRRV